MSRNEVVAAMAQAADQGHRHPYAAASAGLNAATPLIWELIHQHGLVEARLILLGDDPRKEAGVVALRALGADPGQGAPP